jgi:hypothetical protein
MSNFDFLKSYNEEWARAATQAEDLLIRSFPGPCAVSLRTLGEELAKEIVNKLGLRVTRSKKNGSIDFYDRVNAIRSALTNAPQIPDALEKIRNIGNFNAHNFGHCVHTSKESLKQTYEVAAWFMKTVVRSSEPIPKYEAPEVKPENEVPGWKKFLSTRNGKLAVGIAAVIGAIFAYFIATDKDHDWKASLAKTARIVVFALILALLALPLFILANGITIWQAYHLFVSSIADKIGWSEYLIRPLGLVLLLPFFSAVRFTFSWNAKRRLTGMAVLIAMAVGYNLMFYYATKDTPFIIGSGHASKYYERTDQGIVFYDRAGYSPTTGQPLLLVTPDVWREYKIELKQGTDSMTSVDPAAHDWFNPNTGAPMLWYSRSSEGKFDFFPRPGTNPRTGDQLAPVTRDLYQTWAAAHTPKAPKPVTQEDILSQILRPAASGGPGVLLLDATANDQGGVDALNRHLAGVNTSAFPAEVLERRGFAGKFYQGDASLVRKALAITHLNELVIAEVKTDCAKRSSLDSDLLSCNLTANARRFDAQGKPEGSQLVQATGAGFNESAALEEAGKRASTSLLAFAKR